MYGKMYSVMKRISLIFITFFLIAGVLHAEKVSEVLVRAGRQNGNLRIVLESDEYLIKNSNFATSSTVIKIEFPGQFELKKQKEQIEAKLAELQG